MSEDLIREIEEAREKIRQLKISLRAEEMRTKISSEYTNFGLWEYDIAEDISYQYKKLNGKYENNLDPIVNFRDSVLSWGIVFAEDIPAFNRFCDALERGDKDVFCEVRVVNDYGDMSWYRYEGKAVYDENGKPMRIVGRTLDVTKEKEVESSGKNGFDDPSGMYSNEFFSEFIREKRSGLNRYNKAALFSVGIDNFREIMAERGTEYTDRLQNTVAKIVADISTASHDSVSTHVRDGEFLLYLELTGISEADNTAKRILDKTHEIKDQHTGISASIGIALFKSGKKIEDVYSEASAALFEARKSGGHCYMHYSPTMASRSFEHSSEFDAGCFSSGAAKVYDLIVRAFCSEKDRSSLLKAALITAGQYLGATNIYVYNRDGESFTRYMTYNSSDKSEKDCPSIEQSGTDSLAAAFGNNNKLRLHSTNDAVNGVRLSNGAVCAECRAIRCNGEIAECFAIVFDSRFELSEQDLHIIDALENALTEMYNAFAAKKASQGYQRFSSAIISDHRMEGFTIIPGKFIIDFVGNNAAEHYGMRSGDICYKKTRGRSEPCVNCPALQLDHSNKLLASAAQYDASERRWLDITASVELNDDGERRYIISSTDITDCLGRIQMSDTLTGTMTFDVFTAEALRLTASENTENAGNYIAVINIAQFNRINEEKGFETGNSILVTIADILKRCIKDGELLCRSEGARFVVLFKNHDNDDFTTRINLMLNSIQKQVYQKFMTQIYLLVGACNMYDESVSVMGALDRAIIAQNRIRDKTFYTQNILMLYDGELREKIREQRFIEENMLSALKNNEFRVYYQPKVSITTGKVVGAETLVRWIRPDGQIIPPGKFVPLFEQNGFITEMDFAIYRQAVADIKRWLREGIDVPLISLNVSRCHLNDDNFCEKFNALVDGIGVPHELIELEITESLLTENLDRLIETVTMLKEKGFRISIDDFGSGYSSLNLITMLPFDTLKIDGGFFLKNDLTEKNKKVITSVVTLAKSLNLETVSEGVETQCQVDFLRELGCDMIQGFFYYRPLPLEEFHKILVSQRMKNV